ncbi:MAG: sugar ABC transporter ATP-binding protein [Chloroflexota bacterium]|nr:sugar ABC transporter ATP-binding protein [Chloroflexota bacterium]
MDDVLLRASGIHKHFGGIMALRGVDLELRAGEIHALMGENGAGKSTMAKIIAGVEQPDSGTLTLRGQPVTFRDTTDAIAAGITIVLQELSLIPDLSVAENIFLVHRDAYRGGFWLDRETIRTRTHALFQRLEWEHPVDPDRKVSRLSVAEQQMVEILRALSLEARLFILDEPTAALSPREVAILFKLVRRLRHQGATFLLVTHRLDEVFALADRITVYRDGAPSGHFDTAATSEPELIRAMVGRDLGDLFRIRHRRPPGAAVLSVRRLNRGPLVRDATFEVRRGEVVGIAGLIGAGRTELVRAVFGADRIDRGEVELRGRAGLLGSPRTAVRHGTAMVPEDRKGQGLLIDLPIAHNVALADLAANGGFWLRPRRELRQVRQLAADLRIKAPRLWQAANSLSGGNQQKVVLAKWLAIEPELLILDEPTRGIDIGTKFELYKLIDGLAASAKAILLVSSELPEILALADRVLVVRNGAIVAELAHAEATEELILAHATGETATTSTAGADVRLTRPIENPSVLSHPEVPGGTS